MNLSLNDSDYVNRLLARSRCGDPQREADARLELEQWVAVSDDNRRCYEAQRQTVIALDASLDSLRQRYPRHLAPASAAAPALAACTPRAVAGLAYMEQCAGVAARGWPDLVVGSIRCCPRANT